MQSLEESPWSTTLKPNVMIDTWTSYAISLEEFKEAILEKGLPFGRSRSVTEAKAGPAAVKLVEVGSVDEAKEWSAHNA